MVEFRILGPLEVLVDEQPLDLGPHKQRALLALLLLRAKRVVTTERILDELWGDEALGKERALWVNVSRLRSALEPDRGQRGESTVLLTRDHGYVLEVDDVDIDANQFEAEARAGQAKLRDGDAEGAASTLRAALGLWRGSALQDFPDDDFARGERTRLEELRLAAIEDRIDADIERGEARAVIGELEALREQEPLRERPVGQLMRALYFAGRHVEALRTFERFRHHLADELGLAPSPELARLEERVLLHDLGEGETPAPPQPASATAPAGTDNPYKGLHAFRESDAQDFFGRDRLVREVIDRLATGDRLVALIGPSGSGKSSAVRGGVVPTLRRGAVSGSDGWVIAQMLPGSQPFAELEAAVRREAVDGADRWPADPWEADDGLLRAALSVLPDDESTLLLVVDQFEELFTAVERDDVRRRFLACILTALDDARGRVRVLLTLRADSYHRPLEHPAFGSRLGSAIVNVVPLLPDELELAAQAPAARVGVSLEGALLAELLADVIGQPAALPMFQYALTELFARREGDRMTVESYRELGGVEGVLRQRAEEVYTGLDDVQQDAAEQLFLRLATVEERGEWTRRRVLAEEILSMEIDVGALQAVLDRFGAHRFLAFDRDPVSGAPTVEVAHEALLREWDRLRDWIEAARGDLRRHATLVVAIQEWRDAGEDPDYLLDGARLTEYERWRANTRMRLTAAELEFLANSRNHRDDRDAQSSVRQGEADRLRRSSRRRLWALVAAIGVVGALTIPALLADEEEPATVVLAYSGEGNIAELAASALAQQEREGVIEVVELTPPFGDLEASLRAAAADGPELVLSIGLDFGDAINAVAPDFPDIGWVLIDAVPGASPDATSVAFAEEQGSFLAGAAAALVSSTGTIGFVGGLQFPQLERFRAGFEAGAHAADADVEVLATYASVTGDGFVRPDLAEAAATALYDQGADVVYQAAGMSGEGVFAAARTATAAAGEQRWAIGVDTDQYLEVDSSLQPFILTSMVKRYDLVVSNLVEQFLDGQLDPGTLRMTLADGAMSLSDSGGHLEADVLAAIDRLRDDVASGAIDVPTIASGALLPPPNLGTTVRVEVHFDGETCSVDGPSTVSAGTTLELEAHNDATADAAITIETSDNGVAVPVAADGTTTGFVAVHLPASVLCYPSLEFDRGILGGEIDVT